MRPGRRLRAVGRVLRDRAADDRGSAVVEFVILAVVLLVPLIYLVLCLARVQAGSYAVAQAAREAGRAFVTAADDGSAEARSRAAARSAPIPTTFSTRPPAVTSCP